uniref:Uncharacterized protein n=1 Tax=viral metagenome TaxID=1070528 RepID=A0A6C0JSJ7_9ZZZZ
MYEITEEDCIRWKTNNKVNPKTNRKIQFGKKTFCKVDKAITKYEMNKLFNLSTSYNKEDPITLEEFTTTLKNYEIVMIDKKNDKFHCFLIETFLEYVNKNINNERIINPLNPSYFLDKNDFDQIKTKIKYLNPKLKLISSKMDFFIGKYAYFELTFYLILIFCKGVIYECGVFPACEPECEDMLHKLYTSFRNDKIILSYNPFLCISKHFCRDEQFWCDFNTDSPNTSGINVNRKLLLEFIDILNGI